jgi:SlyX protein
MSDPTTADQRIAELEIQLAHQEATIQELSDTAAKQWDTIDELVVRVNDLKDRIAALEGEAKLPAQADDTPPPHY